MEKLISSKFNVQSVPESYILPLDTRPGELFVPLCNTIPVIDLQQESDRSKLAQKIVKAAQEFGFFQLVNYGVSEKLMQDMLAVAEEFFELPAEEKKELYSEDPKKSCRLYTSIDYVKEKVHFWRDNLRHSCHPLEDHIQFWPQNPPSYREVVGKYSVEVRKLSLWILELICEGLGLEEGYFEKGGLTKVQSMTLNHYPPCPNPSLTLGLPKHADVNLITLLYQGQILGLQVLKDDTDQWLAVEPLPNAFVVNIGHMLHVISNGKVKSAEHRAVTNVSTARTTVVSFIHPSGDSHIEAAKAMLNYQSNPPLYKPFIYKDFVTTYVEDTQQGQPPLQRYELLS